MVSSQAQGSLSDRRTPFTRKLSLFVPLSQSDHDFADTLTTSDEHVQADSDLIREGMAPRAVFLLKEGMAIRYRNLLDGTRQILTILIPGDLCNPHIFLLDQMDHSIGTIVPARIASIPRDRMMTLFLTRPRISAALWWGSLQEEAMLRERIVSLGRRDARGRVAYLLCELFWRFEAIGMTVDGGIDLPLTQNEIADTLGLTPVHVNRVLRRLRDERLIDLGSRRLAILDLAELQLVAGFNRDYLHLGRASKEVTRYFDALEADRGR